MHRSFSRLPSLRPLAAVAVCATLLGGCISAVVHESPSPSAPPGTTRPTSSPSVGPSASPIPSVSATATPAPTVAPTTRPTATAGATASASAGADCAADVLASLSEAQRVGQLFMIGLVKDRLDDAERAAIRDQHVGSMLFTATTTAGVDGIRAVTDAVQAQATQAATGRIGFLIAANQEGGLIQALRGKGFQRIPSAVEQGTMAPSTLEQDAARWGRELVRAGVNLDLAPVADVVPPGTEDDNAPIGQLQREYGGDPVTVGTHVAAFIRGLAAGGAATSAKHFPGLGRVAGNTDHVADVVDSVTTRDDAFVRPFGAAIRAGVPFVMVSLATYERIDPPTSPCSRRSSWAGCCATNSASTGSSCPTRSARRGRVDPAGQRAIDYIAAGGDMLVVNQTADAVEMARALLVKANHDDASGGASTRASACAAREGAARPAALRLARPGPRRSAGRTSGAPPPTPSAGQAAPGSRSESTRPHRPRRPPPPRSTRSRDSR